MVKLVRPIIVFIIIMTLFSGCHDAREIDDVVHVLAIGVDKGVSDKWRLTLQFATMKENSDGDGQDGYTYVSVDAPSFFTGIDMLNSSVPRRLTFTHTGLIVLSEELAKDSLIEEYIAPLMRYRQVRGTTYLAVSKGSALEFIKENQPFIGTTLSKAFETGAKESTNTGFFGHTTLRDFYNQLKSTYAQPVVTMTAVNKFNKFKEQGPKWGNQFKTGGEYSAGLLPRQGQNKIEFLGTALFNKDKMVSELNGDQTRILLMIRGEFERGFFTLQDPKEPTLIIPLDVRQARKPKVKISFNGDVPTIDLTIYLKGDLLAVQSGLHYEQDPLLSLLERTVREDIKKQVDQLINKCKNLNIDVFKFGDVAARKFLTINQLEKYNWNENFKDIKVNTEVEFVIKRTGTQIKSSPIPSSSKEEE